MRIDRLLAITVMLLNRGRVSARELADEFEVSVRTIYRDVEAINMAGIPVVSYPGNNGGFGIMENFRLDRQVLSLSDMAAILSALKGISASLDSRGLDAAIEKISSLVPGGREGRDDLVSERLVVDMLPWGYRKRQKDLLQRVNEAVHSRRLIEFTYRNSRGEAATRTVEPMTLIFKGFAWYLFAYCVLREDYRVFRLSRMEGLSVLDVEFTRRDESYRRFMGSDLAVPSDLDMVLRFLPAVRHRVEDYFDREQIAPAEDGGLIVRASFPEDEWVYSMILGYGEHVVVLEPPHLREIIEKKAKKITELYKPDIGLSRP